MEIVRIELDSSSMNRNKLIKYARNCSWQGTGKYLADLLENNEFDTSEKVFAAIHNNDVIGFIAIVNNSCADFKDLYPWLDFLFVDEKYRSRGIAKKLIESVFTSARDENISSIYLCTVTHREMYEKYGFSILYKTIINGSDECYIMEKKL